MAMNNSNNYDVKNKLCNKLTCFAIVRDIRNVTL